MKKASLSSGRPAPVAESAAEPVAKPAAESGAKPAAEPVAAAEAEPLADVEPAACSDRRTRDRVTDLLLRQGAATATQLATELGLSPVGIRRHLEAMLAEGQVVTADQPGRAHRGRGRPARLYRLTDAGRASFPHTYDDLAAAALRWISAIGGPSAVTKFAADQVVSLEERCRAAMAEAGADPIARADALAGALTAEGYVAGSSTIASGGQLCQHHCPVAHVAAEFPQLCEAETQVISRLVGTHVQRLATIANGDGICTTHIPARYQPAQHAAAPRETAPRETAPRETAPRETAPRGAAPRESTQRAAAPGESASVTSVAGRETSSRIAARAVTR